MTHPIEGYTPAIPGTAPAKIGPPTVLRIPLSWNKEKVRALRKARLERKRVGKRDTDSHPGGEP